MRAAGADVKVIQQQLGHRSATVTLNTCTHLFDGDLDEEMDRLDAHSATKSRPGAPWEKLWILRLARKPLVHKGYLGTPGTT